LSTSARGGAAGNEAVPEVGCCGIPAQAVAKAKATTFNPRESQMSQQFII